MQGKSDGMFFSLRNFKLHLNQMLELQLDVNEMAQRIDTTLTMMHWAARADARDGEFVLGSSAERTPVVTMDAADLEKITEPIYTGPPSFSNDDFLCRKTELWVLDFNQVRDATGADAVSKMVEAYGLNDPSYPKPLCQSAAEKQVWESFVTSYFETSVAVLGATEMIWLPLQFILEITDKLRNSKGWKTERKSRSRLDKS